MLNLEKEIGYLLFTFKDNSKLLLRTTYNDDLLGPLGVLKNRPKGHLYDLDRRRWIRIPDPSEAYIQITQERPVLEEVDEFANRYI